MLFFQVEVAYLHQSCMDSGGLSSMLSLDTIPPGFLSSAPLSTLEVALATSASLETRAPFLGSRGTHFADVGSSHQHCLCTLVLKGVCIMAPRETRDKCQLQAALCRSLGGPLQTAASFIHSQVSLTELLRAAGVPGTAASGTSFSKDASACLLRFSHPAGADIC